MTNTSASDNSISPTSETHGGQTSIKVFPELDARDRQLFQNAIQRLQSRTAIAALNPDDEAAWDLFDWAERHLDILEAYFHESGVGLRRHEGFRIIQLALIGDAASHPLRRRLDKTQTGVLVCLWLLYHERIKETSGFRVVVTIEEIYARLSSLFASNQRLLETPMRDVLQFFERYCLVETDFNEHEFTKSAVALLPTIITTFHFADPDDARTALDTLPQPSETNSGNSTPVINTPLPQSHE